MSKTKIEPQPMFSIRMVIVMVVVMMVMMTMVMMTTDVNEIRTCYTSAVLCPTDLWSLINILSGYIGNLSNCERSIDAPTKLASSPSCSFIAWLARALLRYRG